MTVDGRDDGGSDLQLELVHQQVEVDVAHGHCQGREGQAEGISVAPPAVDVTSRY